MTNTRLGLMYRDGNNYKHCQTVVLCGTLEQADLDLMMQGLDDGQFIICEQVGLPTPSDYFRFLVVEGEPSSWGSPSDHVWTTILDFSNGRMPDLSELSTDQPVTPGLEGLTAKELAQRIGNADWDIAKESKRIGV